MHTSCMHACVFACACTCLCSVHSSAAVMDGVLCCSTGAISQPESRGWPPGYEAPHWGLKARTDTSLCVFTVFYVLLCLSMCNLAFVQRLWGFFLYLLACGIACACVLFVTLWPDFQPPSASTYIHQPCFNWEERWNTNDSCMHLTIYLYTFFKKGNKNGPVQNGCRKEREI